MMRAYLLLDSNQIPELYPRLHELAQIAVPHSLYLTTQYAELAHCGPVLTAVEPNSVLAKVFAEEWQEKAGIWLESDADEAMLVAHLRSLIHVQIEGEVSAFFRYYDPCITRLWLEDLTVAERDRLMGPVCLIRLPDGEGGMLSLKRESLEQAGERYGKTPWLSFSAQELEHLSQSKRQRFWRQMVEHCLAHFPECLQGVAPSACQQWAIDCSNSAERQGYSAEDEILRWIALYGCLGKTFPDAPEHDVYRQLLAERSVLPGQRLDNLLAELSRQIAFAEIDL